MRASNLKVLITSATLNGEKVSKFFCDCPILNVPGKLFPVEIRYSSERPKSYLESSLKAAIGMLETLLYCHLVVNFISLFCYFSILLWYCILGGLCIGCSIKQIVPLSLIYYNHLLHFCRCFIINEFVLMNLLIDIHVREPEGDILIFMTGQVTIF